MKKKILASALATCILIPAALTLGACGKKPTPPEPAKTFTISENVLNNADTIVDNILENLHNSMSSGTYTIEDVQDTHSGFTYYVELGTMGNIDSVGSITIGGIDMQKDEVFKLSIGNNAFIEGKCFLEHESKLYLAAPIVVFEANNGNTIKINNSTFDLNLSTLSTKDSFFSIESTGSTQPTKNGDVWNVTLNSGLEYLRLDCELAYDSNTSILAKKVLGNKLMGYAIDKTNGSHVEFYPCYKEESFSDEDITKFSENLTFEVYILGQRTCSIVLDIDLVNPEN